MKEKLNPSWSQAGAECCCHGKWGEGNGVFAKKEQQAVPSARHRGSLGSGLRTRGSLAGRVEGSSSIK